ncbi:MAG: hypothetical protein RJA49_1177 [Actinomycetota bacterium]
MDQAMAGTRLRRRRTAGAALGLLILTGGPAGWLARHVVPHSVNGPAFVTTYLVGGVSLVAIVACWQELHQIHWRRLPPPLVPIIAFISFELLSAFWSVSASFTAQQALQEIGIVAFGVWFGLFLRTKEQIWSVALAGGSAIVLSTMVILIRPEYGRMFPNHPTTNWSGIFANRNPLAHVCVLAIIGIVGVMLSRRTIATLVVGALLIADALWLLVHTRGATAMAALLLAAAVGVATPLLWFVKRRGCPGWAVVATLFAALAAALWWTGRHVGVWTSRLGRDTTINGRSNIWDEVMRRISQRPWAGYGWFAFWQNKDLAAASRAVIGFRAAHAHNSALEVFLGLGLIGFVLYLMILGWSVIGVGRIVWFEPGLRSWWWAVMLTFLLVINQTTTLVGVTHIWVLSIAAACVAFNVTDATKGEPLADVVDLPEPTTDQSPGSVTLDV